MTFINYLEEQFFKVYTGTKDQAEDAFEAWQLSLDIQEIIDMADEYKALN